MAGPRPAARWALLIALVGMLCAQLVLAGHAHDHDHDHDHDHGHAHAHGSAAGVVGADSVTSLSLSTMTLHELDEQLKACPIVQTLNAAHHGHDHDHAPSSLTHRLFAVLFPAGPAVNAILATLYISGPPNFLLALCPPNIDPASLSVMVAFAVGGLLGDTLFHLLPEIFLGEEEGGHGGGGHGGVKFVLVEPNRNLLLGLAILVGFVTFVAMDKGLRIATGGQGGHDHSHGHSHAHAKETTVGAATGADVGVQATEGARARGKGAHQDNSAAKTGAVEQVHGHDHDHDNDGGDTSKKLGGYLNLIADFTHNITDGLAMAASFYASPTVGATTTVAVFFHEIPHEVGDFALLVQSGFSKRAAMGAQFVTAVGALLGTLIGIAVQELGGNGASAHGGDAAGMPITGGLMGTSLTWGDMLLPFTAGTFLYVGTVSVIPELLETGKDKAVETKKMAMQFAAIAAGAGVMLYISWHE